MALNAETKNVTLNVKLRSDDGSEYQTENATLNVKLRSDGSERRNWECDSERQTKKWWWLWMPKLRSDNDGSECRNWETTMMALNAETENAMRMALNADTKKWWL